MDFWAVMSFGVVGYVAGSIPFAYLIARAHGVDLRQVGSGNIGATNCGRALGKKWGLICFLLDAAKGTGPALAAGVYFGWIRDGLSGPGEAWAWLGIAVMAMVGHMFPVWLKFKGGKGVATGFGLILGIWPYLSLPALGALLIWILFAGMFRYVSYASMIAAGLLPLIFLLLTAACDWHLAIVWPLLLVTSLMALLVILRHRSNITRLLAGTESRLK